MDDIWSRIADHLVDRVSGPLKFRLILQPTMATLFAVRSGLRDAKAGRPAYLWGLISNPAERVDMMKDGLKSVGVVFVMAFVLDSVFQIIVLRYVYVSGALMVALTLAIVPYVALRGVVTSIANMFASKQ